MTALPLILALDISKTCTGVAFGRVGETPRFLSIKGDDLTVPKAMKRLGSWVFDYCKTEKPDALYYEAPLAIIPGEYDPEEQRVKARGNPNTTIALAKMTGVVEFVAELRGIPFHTARVSTVRKSFVGQGYPRNPKRHVKLLCREIGWSPANGDEADAGAVWYWACLQVAPRHAMLVTPMQQRKITSIMEGGQLSVVA